jgi:hypothetical protein
MDSLIQVGRIDFCVTKTNNKSSYNSKRFFSNFIGVSSRKRLSVEHDVKSIFKRCITFDRVNKIKAKKTC